MLGVGNLTMVGSCKGRTKQLKLVKDTVKDNFEIKELYSTANAAMVPFPETPTSNYLMPKEGDGVCALVAITNVLEYPPFKNMKDFILVLAGQRGLNRELEVKLYQQLGSLYRDFKTPVALKFDHPKFRWYSCLLVHRLPFQALDAMVKEGRSLNEEMEMLMERTGDKSYVLVA